MLIKLMILTITTAVLANHHHNIQKSSHHAHEYKYHGPPAPLKQDGTVDETPEVKHAKAAHFAALMRTIYGRQLAPLKYDGTVDDTEEVKHAKAVHFRHYNEALNRDKRSTYYVPAPLNHDGTVADTKEVLQAKNKFFSKYATEYDNADHSWVEPKYYDEPTYKYVQKTQQNNKDLSQIVTKHEKPHHREPSHSFVASILSKTGDSNVHYGKKDEIMKQQVKTVNKVQDEKKLKAVDLSASKHSKTHHSKKYYELAPLNQDGTVADTDDIIHAKASLVKAYNDAYQRLYYAHKLNRDQNDEEHEKPKDRKKQDATVRQNQTAHRYKRSAYFEAAPLNHDGTVDDTQEVKQARENFLAAHAAEVAMADHSWVEPEYKPYKPTTYHISTPQHYTKYFVPAPLNHDGTVADTPEIEAAKAIHFAAHQKSKQYYPYHYSDEYSSTQPQSESSLSKKHYIPAPLNPDGTVADTPEVQHAKAAFLAAYSNEYAQADHSWVEPEEYNTNS